ncbi:DUF4190 domain-containing protein [Demequina sp. SO4-18]|uniref:DUF4190 domain-containing protein n=1 Tax=Demequina sp. SO4-18 TaxID=3401026 RepID=UPI003B5C149E
MPDSDGRDDQPTEGAEQPSEGVDDGAPPSALSPYLSESAPTPADASPPTPASAGDPSVPADQDERAAADPDPAAGSPGEDDTQVMDPVDDQSTQVMDPVEDDPEPRRAPWAPVPSDRGDEDADDEDADDATAQVPAEPSTDRNWLGVAAFVTGALALSVVAIVLGHLGLSAAKRRRANNRSFSIAGLILGYLGLILTAAGAWLYLSDPSSGADMDARAQQDVSAVGAAAATDASQSGQLPDVEQVEAGYRVGDDTITAHLTGDPSLAFTGTTATNWCLSISYEGGEQSAFHYVATSGMAAGPCPGGD